MILIMRKARLSQKTNSGNILFLILIAVALFAALSYTVTQMGRTPGSTIENEKAKLSQAEIDSYTAQLNQGKSRLELINNCKNIDYTPPADQVAGDKSCHMFHPDGAGVAYRDLGLGLGCELPSMAVGENCNGLVYAGTSGGNRLYTTGSDLGNFRWHTSGVNPSGLNDNDGLNNTDILVGISADFEAANACRGLGEKWYLPAPSELVLLFNNKSAIGGFTSSNSVYYWSSTNDSTLYPARDAKGVRFTDGQVYTLNLGQTSLKPVRCVRR